MTSVSPQPVPSSRRRGLTAGVITVLVIAVLVAIGSGQGWFGGGATSPSGSPDASVPVHAIELQAAVPGTVAGLPVAEGDAVTEGEILLALDSSAATAQAAQAQAGVDAATAGVAQAKAGLAQ